MKSWVIVALVPVLLSGCAGRNPFQQSFTPYGPQCVPPPPTGTIGYGQGYYVPQNYTASVPVGGQTTRTGQLQPVPAVPVLGSQPASPTTPRTSAAPPNNQEDWESTKTAIVPSVDLGASRAPVQPQRAMPRGVERDNSLAWTPPFGNRAVSGGVVQTSATSPYPTSPYPTSPYNPPQPSYNTTPSYVAPIAATTPDYNPIRPSIVRPATYGSPIASRSVEDCNCDVTSVPSGVPVPQPFPIGEDPYASGPYAGMEPVYSAVENSNWQRRR